MHTPDAHAARMAVYISTALRELRAAREQRFPVDLTGMEWGIGRLCAACLDLPAAQGRAMRARLQDLVTELDALHATVQDVGP